MQLISFLGFSLPQFCSAHLSCCSLMFFFTKTPSWLCPSTPAYVVLQPDDALSALTLLSASHSEGKTCCLATQLPAEHMARTNGDDQIFWSVPLAPWTVKAKSTKTLPTASPLACQWVREDFSLLFSYLKENFLPAVQMVGIVSLPVCFSPLQPITQNLS